MAGITHELDVRHERRKSGSVCFLRAWPSAPPTRPGPRTPGDFKGGVLYQQQEQEDHADQGEDDHGEARAWNQKCGVSNTDRTNS